MADYIPSSPGLKQSTRGSPRYSSTPTPAPTSTVVYALPTVDYVPKIGDITDSEGNLVRTEAIKRPGGGYYSVDSPETTALREEYGLSTEGRPTTSAPVDSKTVAQPALTPNEESELSESVLAPVDEPTDDEDDGDYTLLLITVVIVILAAIFAFGRK